MPRPIPSHAFTLTSNGRLRQLQTTVQVCPPIINPSNGPTAIRSYEGIWDTGAMGSAISQRVVDDLALSPTGMKNVHTANGPCECETYLLDFILPNNVHVPGLNVTLANLGNLDVLIGMDVITHGDFSITNVGGKTKMSFCIPSAVEVDFVKEVNRQRRPNKKFTPPRNKRKR